MKADLDNMGLIADIDRSNMLGAVDRFPDALINPTDEMHPQLRRAKSSFQNLVLMGMGGSASAADVVLDWLRNRLKLPSLVLREPSLPAFVNSRTLFVTVSYSGETSETLAAFRAAGKRRAHLVGIGTGGKLATLCGQSKAPFVQVEQALAPRAALSQLVVATTATLEGLGLVRSASREMTEAGRALARLRNRLQVQTSSERNPAKRLASKLLGHFIALYSLQRMSSVARRFKNQLAENSKEFAKYGILPEASHNEIEAWASTTGRILPVFVRDEGESVFEHSLIEAFRSTIRTVAKVHPLDVRIPSRGSLSRLLAPIFFLDYVSVYLAILKRVDPTPTDLITRYKERLKS